MRRKMRRLGSRLCCPPPWRRLGGEYLAGLTYNRRRAGPGESSAAGRPPSFHGPTASSARNRRPLVPEGPREGDAATGWLGWQGESPAAAALCERFVAQGNRRFSASSRLTGAVIGSAALQRRDRGAGWRDWASARRDCRETRLPIDGRGNQTGQGWGAEALVAGDDAETEDEIRRRIRSWMRESQQFRGFLVGIPKRKARDLASGPRLRTL